MTRKSKKKLGRSEDAALWRYVADSVTPLDPEQQAYNLKAREFFKALVDEERAPPPPSPGKTKRHQPPHPAPHYAPAKQLVRNTSLPELAHGIGPGVDKRTGERLRKGRLPIEATMDLHGMTADQAHRALDAFILGAAAAGKRCVRVVTSKGRGRTNDFGQPTEGVIKRSAPMWLNGARLRPLVLSFTHARPQDGGEGALYVLLKRKR